MIQLDWDNEAHTIIRYTFFQPWTWEEYHTTEDKRDEMFDSVIHMIDIILDFTQGKQIPDKAMSHLPQIVSWENPKRGIVIVIGVSRMLQALANVLISIYPQAALKAPRPARDLNHARQMIDDVRRKREQITSIS